MAMVRISRNRPFSVRRVTQAFMPMKKLDIETLKKAYEER